MNDKWLVVVMMTEDGKVSTPVFQVTASVALQIRNDVKAGTPLKESYPVENYPDAGVGGDILLDVQHVALIRSYDSPPNL